MALKATVSLTREMFDVFADTTSVTPAISEKNAAVMSAALSILLVREVWEPMSDSEWDDWEGRLSNLLGDLTP